MAYLSRLLMLPLALAMAGATASALHAQQPADTLPSAAGCPLEPREGVPDPDLYCIDLLATPDLDAGGQAVLAPARTPFGTAVGPDGRHQFDVSFAIAGLPEPATLGPYTQYVAWVTTPTLDPMVRLGVVRNGRTTIGRAAFNKFFLLITAEPAGTSDVRRGRIVLRGMSASTRLGPHALQMLPSNTDGHAGHGMPGENGWVMPPEDPNVPPMPMAGLQGLVPQATPFLPGAGVDTALIPLAIPRRIIDLRDGDTLKLAAGLVRRVIRGRTLIMYGFNGQYPGPLLRAPRNATVLVDFLNNTDFDSAVHWHGIRLDNASDGVPHVTQEPVHRGETFRYRVHFPDAGIYWYHPHHREDVQQDLGLYGNILVRPDAPDYFAPAGRDEFLMLDDLLLNADGSLFPYGKERATHAVMGRFGNLLLVNGEPSYTMQVGRGEVVRYYVTNVSNTRTFNISFDGAPMKLVASDAGKYEREEWVESVVIAPAERYVVDVRFPKPGTVSLVNRVQAIDHVFGGFYTYTDTLVTVHVSDRAAARNDSASFQQLRRNADVATELTRFRGYFDAPLAHSLSLRLEPKTLPFALLQLMKLDSMYFHPVEWAGTMPMMDWLPTTGEVRWVLRDTDTGAENEGIHWRFRRGDVARIRITNERRSLHAMQHPIHLHGQRFLVLTKNGVRNDNLVWKDTALVPVGETIDLLVDMSNPGAWMLHCHIAEHLEAGMQMIFQVE